MIVLPTDEPENLLRAIRDAIDRKQVRTWNYDSEGDFTHSSDQWVGQAWLRPEVGDDALRLFIIPPADTHISTVVYGVYHGRFIEMALSHFDTRLNGFAQASPGPEGHDQIQ